VVEFRFNKRDMHSEQRTLDLIDRIYAAADNQSLWPNFLEHLAETLRCAATNLFIQDLRHAGGMGSATFNTDPAFNRSYAEHYGKVNIFLIRGKSLLRAGNVCFSDELCPDAEAERSEFYNDWILPQGHGHGLLGVVFNDQSLVGNVGAIRGHSRTQFGREEKRLLGILMPHLQRAVELQRRINQLEALHAGTTEALDHWTTAVFLVDESGRVLLANRSAEEVLNNRDGLFLECGTLHGHGSTDTGALHRAIREASCPGLLNGISRRTLSMSRPSGRRPLSVFVARALRRDLFFNAPGSALVFVSDPEGAHPPCAEILQHAYGLTSAEANVASLLATGKDIREIADGTCVRQNTVRVQLKRIFDKTGTRRQAELVKLILTGPAFLRTRPHE
jgi:DNA-binding CsgD family transcriptional regulator